MFGAARCLVSSVRKFPKPRPCDLQRLFAIIQVFGCGAVTSAAIPGVRFPARRGEDQ